MSVWLSGMYGVVVPEVSMMSNYYEYSYYRVKMAGRGRRMEKQKVVMDASVCARWFLDEEYSDRARVLRDSFVKGTVTIAVPSLLFYETLNALRYSGEYRERELSLAATCQNTGLKPGNPRGRCTGRPPVPA